jgi:polyisoprenyl-teichoic acid--peptidoglycan teichoic acid transferase
MRPTDSPPPDRWGPGQPDPYTGEFPEPPTDPPARRGSGAREHRRSWLQRLILTVGTTVVVVALLGLSAATYALVKYLGIERVSDLGTDVAAPGDPQNYLVVGSDSRGDGDGATDIEGQRSDTIMIVRIDPEAEQAAILSIPRDLVVPIAGTEETARINSAYARGRSTLIDTIRDNFSIEIHHYVEIDFAGFARLIDYAGGVPLWVGAAIKDSRSGLFVEELGCVTLDGEQALAYVRSRQLQYMTEEGTWSRPDPSADLGRIERQQIFMRNALTKALEELRSNPAGISELVDIAVDNVAIDDRLSVRELLDLGDHFRDFEADSLLTYPLPIIERGDGATLALDRSEAEPILNIFRGLDPGEIAPGLVTVTVLNGTGEEGQANDVAGALQVIGFEIDSPGDSDERPERTRVYHRPGDEAYGLRVARHITGGADVLPRDDLGLDEAEVVVVTGSDLTTIHREPTPLDQMPSVGPAADPDAAEPAAAVDDSTDEDSTDDAATEEPAPTDAQTDAPVVDSDPPPRPELEPTIEDFVVGDPPPGTECT